MMLHLKSGVSPVKLLMLIANRHLNVGHRPGATMTRMIRGEVVEVPLALDMDIWVHHILPYLGRDAFRTAPHVKRCEVCGGVGDGMRPCQGCEAGHFCSRECVLRGWKDHKKRCPDYLEKKAKERREEEAVAQAKVEEAQTKLAEADEDARLGAEIALDAALKAWEDAKALARRATEAFEALN